MASGEREPKSKPTTVTVDEFLAGVAPPSRAADARVILAMMQEISGEPPTMWGPSMIGFGRYAYRYESGHSGVAFRIGFSPRKANMVVYIMPGFDGAEALLARLGRYKIGKACLYLGPLSGVDLGVLRALVQAAWEEMARRYPAA